MGLNPEVGKYYSGFRPTVHYLGVVGLNPEFEKLDSGFRPRGQYIALVGLNPEVEKLDSGFRPRGHYLSRGFQTQRGSLKRHICSVHEGKTY